MSTAVPKPRQAGRAILRDDAGRVLLILFVLPNMTFWAGSAVMLKALRMEGTSLVSSSRDRWLRMARIRP